uniref:CAP-Gly domain-containing protein n=1 Tax=Graphocephala atropunctata TaxID=36148 RepID=A0A1B6LNK3_9HEMI
MEVGNQGQVGGVVYTERQSLDTVRALHQTVVSLRAALEQSRAELHSLRQQVEGKVNPAIYEKTIEKLSLENHVLRQRVLSSENVNSLGIEISLSPVSPMTDQNKQKCMDPTDNVETEVADDTKVCGSEERNGLVDQPSIENGEEIEKSIQEDGDQSISSATSQQGAGTPRISKGESEDSEELDDIELIFTTDDKELSGLHEDLVSISESDTWHVKRGSDREVNDIVSNSNLKHTWTQSVFVETDISKCGVIDEDESPQVCRRNTLPNTVPYRPIIHREAVSGSKGQLLDQGQSSPRPLLVKFSQNARSPRSTRPILAERNSNKQESEAQTDITALPAHWRSESFLAHHKVAHNFTTLPSKFAIPVSHCAPRKQSLRLSEKTQEARRVLLSDINFTSMVPELSRSADHLCNEVISTSNLCKNYPRAFSYMKNADSVLSPGYLGRAPWSPCDCNNRHPSWEYYQGSLMSIPSPSVMDMSESARRRHSMKPSISSLDTWNSSYCVRPNWSVPTSPTHCRRSRSVPFSASYMHSAQPESSCYSMCCPNRRQDSKLSISSSSRTFRPLTSSKSQNRVTFQDTAIRRPGHSLPDLRFSLEPDSGEDSTDSLIEESEEFLRRSIDSMVTGTDFTQMSRKRRSRRHSEPHPFKDFEPPKSQPFIAKVPRDLKLNYWVKVITLEGRVVVGKVRYVGPLPGKGDESFVGVQLGRSDGNSDGSFGGRRFFDCDADCALFLPFKKVVIAWSN